MVYSNSLNSDFKLYGNTCPKSYGSGADYSQAPAAKALGVDPALAGWIEEAKAYIREVQSGQTRVDDPAAYQELVTQQLPWAMSQAQQSGWGDPGMVGGDYGQQQGPQVNDFGGEMGPDGTFNYDIMKTEIGFTGDGTRNDVYGTDNTLNLEQPSAHASFEMTQDKGVDVLKVVVTTSKGTAVYYYDAHDSADFLLNANIADPSKVSGLESLPAELQNKIHVEKFDPEKKDAAASQDSSVPGTYNETTHEWEYEAESADETISFMAEPGENQVHKVWGNADISVKPSDTVAITPALNAKAADADPNNDEIFVIVTHRDGTKDTYKCQPGFNCTVHAQGFQTAFGGGKVGDPPPDGWKWGDRVSINGGAESVGTNESSSAARAMVDGLLSLAGKSEAQLLNALKSAGYTEFNTIDDLLEAVKNKTFPGEKPTGRLLTALSILDPTLSKEVIASQSGDIRDADGTKKTHTVAAMNRLMEFLTVLYPDSNISLAHPNLEDWAAPLEFTIDGKTYMWGGEENNRMSVYDDQEETYI